MKIFYMVKFLTVLLVALSSKVIAMEDSWAIGKTSTRQSSVGVGQSVEGRGFGSGGGSGVDDPDDAASADRVRLLDGDRQRMALVRMRFSASALSALRKFSESLSLAVTCLVQPNPADTLRLDGRTNKIKNPNLKKDDQLLLRYNLSFEDALSTANSTEDIFLFDETHGSKEDLRILAI